MAPLTCSAQQPLCNCYFSCLQACGSGSAFHSAFCLALGAWNQTALACSIAWAACLPAPACARRPAPSGHGSLEAGAHTMRPTAPPQAVHRICAYGALEVHQPDSCGLTTGRGSLRVGWHTGLKGRLGCARGMEAGLATGHRSRRAWGLGTGDGALTRQPGSWSMPDAQLHLWPDMPLVPTDEPALPPSLAQLPACPASESCHVRPEPASCLKQGYLQPALMS